MQAILESCVKSDINNALTHLNNVYGKGYATVDIVTTLFKVTKNSEIPEFVKLEFIKVCLY